ncbi:MAG TPA: hypothetical protein DDW52_22120, partial [Planctomycetaceae bacterium]|nr:hypothetical protein [Planctomycetaceae bacterium]
MKQLLPLIGGAVGGLIVLGLVMMWLLSGGITTDGKLDLAMRLLDEGRWDVAGRIARDLAEAVDGETDAQWHYVQGVSKLQAIGDDLDRPQHRVELSKATDHLTKADELGFPIGYRGKGKFYLGWCYFHTYRFEEVSNIFKEPHELWPLRRSDAYRMDVEANLRKMPPDYTQAEKQIAAWEATPGMSDSEKARIELARAQFEFAHERYPDLEKHLLKVPDYVPEHIEASLWRGRWRIEQSVTLSEDSPERVQLLAEARKIIH